MSDIWNWMQRVGEDRAYPDEQMLAAIARMDMLTPYLMRQQEVPGWGEMLPEQWWAYEQGRRLRENMLRPPTEAFGNWAQQYAPGPTQVMLPVVAAQQAPAPLPRPAGTVGATLAPTTQTGYRLRPSNLIPQRGLENRQNLPVSGAAGTVNPMQQEMLRRMATPTPTYNPMASATPGTPAGPPAQPGYTPLASAGTGMRLRPPTGNMQVAMNPMSREARVAALAASQGVQNMPGYAPAPEQNLEAAYQRGGIPGAVEYLGRLGGQVTVNQMGPHIVGPENWQNVDWVNVPRTANVPEGYTATQPTPETREQLMAMIGQGAGTIGGRAAAAAPGITQGGGTAAVGITGRQGAMAGGGRGATTGGAAGAATTTDEGAVVGTGQGRPGATAATPAVDPNMPPDVDAEWWEAFKAEHGGENPIELYGRTGHGMEEALADRGWGDAFFRQNGRSPNQAEWRAHFYRTGGRARAAQGGQFIMQAQPPAITGGGRQRAGGGTQPPVTQPPVTQPPVTQPPVTQPPAQALPPGITSPTLASSLRLPQGEFTEGQGPPPPINEEEWRRRFIPPTH